MGAFTPKCLDVWTAYTQTQRLENYLKCQSEESRYFTVSTFLTRKLWSEQELKHRKQPKNLAAVGTQNKKGDIWAAGRAIGWDRRDQIYPNPEKRFGIRWLHLWQNVRKTYERHAKGVSEIIIPEDLEKICAAIYEPTIKSRKPRGIGMFGFRIFYI